MGWVTEHQPKEGRRAGSGYWLEGPRTSSSPETAHSFLYVAGIANPGAPLLPLLEKKKIKCLGPGYNTPATGEASSQRGNRRIFSVYLPAVKVIAVSQKGDYFYESRALWLFFFPRDYLENPFVSIVRIFYSLSGRIALYISFSFSKTHK